MANEIMHITPANGRRVLFRKEMYHFHSPRQGVYLDGKWVGEILQGSAYFPTQVTAFGKVSPNFRRKAGVKGNVKSVIRQLLIDWVVAQQPSE